MKVACIVLIAVSAWVAGIAPSTAANLGVLKSELTWSGSVVPPKRQIRYRFTVAEAGCYNIENISDKTSVFANLSHRDGGAVVNILAYAQDHGRTVKKLFLNKTTYILDVRHMSPHKGGIFEINIWRTDC